MSTFTRVYCPSNQSLFCGALVELDSFQYARVVLALRMRKGDELVLFNEQAGSFLAIVQQIKDKCTVQIQRLLEMPEQLKPLTVGIPLIKHHRLSFILESVTQLGATSIVPIKFEHSNLCTVKKDKFLKQLIGATEQCGRHSVPLILEAFSVSEFVSTHKFVVCANERSKVNLVQLGHLIAKEENVSVLVGPEGGFSESEQKILQASLNVKNVSLGNLVLRSETAVSSIISQVRLFY